MSIRRCTAEKPSNGPMLHWPPLTALDSHCRNINASDSKTFDYLQNYISAIEYQSDPTEQTIHCAEFQPQWNWCYVCVYVHCSASSRAKSSWKCNLQIQPPFKSTLTLASQLFTAPERPVCWQINSRTCTLQLLQLALFTLLCKFGAGYRSMVVDCQWKCNEVQC